MRDKLSDKTLKNYAYQVEKLKREKVDITDLDDIKKYLENKSLSLRNNIISAIMRETHDDKLMKKLKGDIKENSEKIQKENLLKKNNLTEKEKSKYEEWNEIKKKFDEMSGNSDMKTLMALYVLMPPRRISDYSNMVINSTYTLPKNKNNILWLDDSKNENYVAPTLTDTKTNYYVNKLRNAFFVFNNYKTNRTYKTQIIEIPDELRRIINAYIKHEKLTNDEELLPYNDNKLIYYLQKWSNKNFGKKISASMLRHSFISNYLENKHSLFERKLLALKMAQSINMQDEYDRLPEHEEKNEHKV